ncbi:MAG TPA: glycosyltransferase family 39 protein, partial [Bacteroidota bacterium]|nr:glycosyltransferase family 39 protein [Bacteroidota bacterium]
MNSDPTPRLRGRNDWILLGLLCALFVTECALVLNDTIMYSPDSVNYLVWAQSLAALKGFTNDLGPSAEHYVFNAPLYPLLLAPVVGVFSGSVIAAKLATLAAGVLTLALYYLFLRQRLSREAAWPTAAFLAINPLFILFSTQILSDVPFGLCLLSTLMLLEKTAQAREDLAASGIA